MLSHRDHTDVSDKLNEWFRADQLRLDTLPTSKHLKVKSAALITEFKVSDEVIFQLAVAMYRVAEAHEQKLRTNETDTSRRMTPRKPLQKKKLRTPKAIAAQALKDALNAVLVSQGVVASLQELEDREAMIADMDEWTPVPNFYSSTGGSKMMPAGRESPVLFAQASVYVQRLTASLGFRAPADDLSTVTLKLIARTRLFLTIGAHQKRYASSLSQGSPT